MHQSGIPLIVLEYASVEVGRHIPQAPERIVDMMTHLRCPQAVLASLDAELCVQYEVRPLVQLLQLPKGLGAHMPTDWVPWIPLSFLQASSKER